MYSYVTKEVLYSYNTVYRHSVVFEGCLLYTVYSIRIALYIMHVAPYDYFHIYFVTVKEVVLVYNYKLRYNM